MLDLVVFETGDGGDVNFFNGDLETTNGFFTAIYLALFGGNPGFVTENTQNENTLENLDYWGNFLFFSDNPDQQFNSYTENILKTTAINSTTREIIKGFVIKDLQFLTNLATIDAEVFVDVDRIEIKVRVQQLSSLNDQTFQFIWDSINNELITKRVI